MRPVLVTTALKAAAGAAFDAELAAAKGLGADPTLTAALEPFTASGVPTVAVLARELSALVPALRPPAAAPAREGFLDRLQVNAEKLVRVRPTDEVAGTDAAAVASRIEGKAAQEDIAGAQAELAKLPPPSRAPAEAWIKQVQAHRRARRQPPPRRRRTRGIGAMAKGSRVPPRGGARLVLAPRSVTACGNPGPDLQAPHGGPAADRCALARGCTTLGRGDTCDPMSPGPQ